MVISVRWACVAVFLIALGCDAEAMGTDGGPSASPDSGRPAEDGGPPPTLEWERTSFASEAPSPVQHVTRVLVSRGTQRLHAAWYDTRQNGYMSFTDDRGGSWTNVPVDGLRQVRQIIQLADGTLVIGGAGGPRGILWQSRDDGESWSPAALGSGAGEALPNERSSTIWDLAVMGDGVVISTAHEDNRPELEHATIYHWNPADDSLRSMAPLPGLGGLALVVESDGSVLVSTQESSEHDDPAAAGQARTFRSTDLGVSWQEMGEPLGANRVYRLTALREGRTLLAGSGLSAGFYRSTDHGDSWELRATVPVGIKNWGDPPTPTEFPTTRIYQILELASGALLIGTGNATGDVFLTCDEGGSWVPTGGTANNIVVWGIDQATDGTIWLGTGSRGGDVWRASPPPGTDAATFAGCP